MPISTQRTTARAPPARGCAALSRTSIIRPRNGWHPNCGAACVHQQQRQQQQLRPWPTEGAARRWHQAALRTVVAAAQAGGQNSSDDGDVDVAVFRFTLGIPGFEDRLIPRVVGLLAAALLLVNHVLGAQPAPDAQVRAEVAVLVLAAVSVVVPEVEQRLKEALPGRGRQSMAERVEGATNGFALAPDLPDATKQELAWASSSLIKNTNSCGVVLVRDGRALLARGAVATSAFGGQQKPQPKDVLARVGQGIQPLAQLLSGAGGSEAAGQGDVDVAARQQVYFADRSAMEASSAVAACPSLPKGAQSLLLQALPGAGAGAFLALYSERPRALSDKERRWAAAVALKLAAAR